MSQITFNVVLGAVFLSVAGFAVLYVLTVLCSRVPWRLLMDVFLVCLIYGVAKLVVETPKELDAIVGIVLLVAGAIAFIGRPNECLRGLNGEQWGSRPEDYLDP